MQVNINGVSITLTQEQLEEIAKQTKSKKFEFNYSKNNDLIYALENTYISTIYTNEIFKEQIDQGKIRKTVSGIESAFSLNQRINRLHALAEQLNGLKKWKYDQYNYYIYHANNCWRNNYVQTSYYPEQVYMTKDCAEKICQMLNNNEFELNPKGE